MPKINVAKRFTLNMPDGSSKDFEAGEQNVDKEIADHWFVKAHLVGATFDPKEGSYEYAQRNRALRSEAEAEAAEQQAEADAQTKADAEARAAALLDKTNEAIAVVAQQAQDAMTKKDTPSTDAVTELPAIPLASNVSNGETASADQQSGKQSEDEPGAPGEQQSQAAEQQAEAGETKAE